MTTRRSYVQPVKRPFTFWFGALAFALGLVSVVQFGYLYVVDISKLGLWEREEVLFTEMYQLDQFAPASRTGHDVDSVIDLSLAALGQLKNLCDELARSTAGHGPGLDSARQIVDTTPGAGSSLPALLKTFRESTDGDARARLRNSIVSRQHALQHSLIAERVKYWSPRVAAVALRVLFFDLSFLFALACLTPLLAPLLGFLRAEGRRRISKYVMFAPPVLIWLLLVYCVMLSSGQASISVWTLLLIAPIVAMVVLTNWKPTTPTGLAARRRLRWIVIVGFAAAALVAVVSTQSVRSAVYAIFRLEKSGVNVQVVSSSFVVLGLEFVIGGMLLVATMFYSLLPSMLQLSMPTGSSLSSQPMRAFGPRPREFLKYNCWGWSRHFQYFLSPILRDSGVSVVAGLTGSLVLALAPFYFSSAAYFAAIVGLSDSLSIQLPLAVLVALTMIALVLLAVRFDRERRHAWVPVAISGLMTALIIVSRTQPGQEAVYALLSKLYSIQSSDITAPQLMPLFGVALTLAVLWSSPFLLGVDVAGAKWATQTTFLLNRLLRDMNRHTILFGYGDLGHRIARDIVWRKVAAPEVQLQYVEVLSSRDSGFVDVRWDFVVVDKDPGSFDEVHSDPDFGLLAICEIRPVGQTADPTKLGRQNPIALLGLVGDCKEPRVHDHVNLEASDYVVAAVRDEEAVFPLFNRIYQMHQDPWRPSKTPMAIVGVERSLFGAYLEWRCLPERAYLTYPAFLRGTFVGEMAVADMIKQTL